MNKPFTIFSFLLFVSVTMSGRLSAQSIAINELVSSNQSVIADEDNSFEDWIELYNYGTIPVNLGGFGLSDNANEPFKWVFPNVTLAPQTYLLVWASDKARAVPGFPLHTNFKISASGETIVLTRADSVLVDSVAGFAFPANSSYGRQPDGTGTWKVFATPTPEASNAGITGTVLPPVFSHASGLYQDSFRLSITHPDANANAVIIYTLDGSEPDINNLGGTSYSYKNQYPINPGDSPGPFLTTTYTSGSYTGPVKIYNRSAEPDKYTHINSRQHEQYVPPQPVRKGMVVKAKAYINQVGSQTVTRTFFVWPQGNPFKLPVISLQIQEDYLFDYEKGVYTAGKDFDTWRVNNPANNQWYRPDWCNYWRSGKAWEYPVHVEIFEPAAFASVVSKNGGFRIHGNNSRALPIKSLRLYARDEGNFEHGLFKEKLFEATNPDNKEFKRIMLRGEGTGGSVYYDVVFNRLMQPVFSGVCRIQPAIHFINGEYWGITALRDRFDEHHYALNYGLDADNIVAIDCGGNNCELDAGEQADYDGYIAMRDFIRTADMSNETMFARADSMLCMESFIDHMVLEIFASNDSYERTYWKVRTKENNGYGDGKWRLNVQDFEASMKSNINWLAHWGDVTNSANESLFAFLLANPTFRNNFINRFADLLNTAYTPARFTAIIDTALNEVAPYLTEDANRFPRDFFYRSTERQNLLNWANNRPAVQRDSIRTFFNLSGIFDLQVNVSDPDGGYINVNTVKITPNTPGVSEQPYPWTGVYFQQVPVTLKATPRKGYSFSHWSGDVQSVADSVTISATGPVNVVANFKKDSVATTPHPVYFWLMDNQLTNDTPLEQIDATYTATTLKATLQYTSCLVGYPFNSNDPNWRKASMERRNAPTPVNYRASANQDVPYEEVNMRAIQVKQPMRKDSMENIITLNIPTPKLAAIKLSFAAETDGAAQGLLIEYWNGAKWDTTGMAGSAFPLDSSYALIRADFSQVEAAKNNVDFKARIRFTGTDMEADNGLRVHVNNIAVDGEEDLSSGLATSPASALPRLSAFPNPAQHTLTLESDQTMQSVTIMNLYGQEVMRSDETGMHSRLVLESLPPSVYFVRVQWKQGEKTLRLIKQ